MIRLFVFVFLFPLFSFSQLIFNTPFESSTELDNSVDAWRVNIPGNGSTYELAGNAREGDHCLKMTINPDNIRNEIVKQSIFDWGEEYWIGYSIKVVQHISGYGIITQHRPLPSGPNSLTIMTMSGNKLRFLTSTNDDLTYSTPGSAAIWGGVSLDIDYRTGEWIDIVENFKLTTSGGYYKVWANGKKIININTGTTVYTKDLNGNNKDPLDYLKIGLYYGDVRTSGEVHFDAYKVWEGPGGTYEDVSPLGLSPNSRTIELLELKAFPTAHGFGRYATGGRGGSVYTVTNLNTSGEGSFRNGYLDTSGPRTIVFNVSGNIDYGSTMWLENPHVTIAGQTSPNGVALFSSTGGIEQRVGNSIWRHIKFRGTATDRSNLRFNAVDRNIENNIVDHCSFSWGGAEEMNIAMAAQSPHKVSNMSVQYNIMGGVSRNILMFQGTTMTSFLRNLMTQSQMRGVRKNHPGTDPYDTFHFEEINNILHAFQEPPMGISLGSKFTALNNTRTPSSGVTVNSAINPSVVRGENDGTGTSGDTYAYIDGNLNQVPTGLEQVNFNSYLQTSPYESSDYIDDHILPANQLESLLVPYLGSFWFEEKRDSQDLDYINNLTNRSGGLSYTGTLPTISSGTYIDSNNNGIPDWFDSEYGTNDNNGIILEWDFEEYKVKNTAGYTNLEMYLNWRAGDFQMMVDGIEKPDSSWIFIDEPEPIPVKNNEQKKSAASNILNW